MKTLAQKSYELMFKELESTLVDLSSDRHNRDMPEINLLCAIMVEAGVEHDLPYFAQDNFEQHCYLLKLHKKFVLSLFKRCWRIEQSGGIWEATAPINEEDV